MPSQVGATLPKHVPISSIVASPYNAHSTSVPESDPPRKPNRIATTQLKLGDEEGDEDDAEHMDLQTIQTFADKVQHLPAGTDADAANETRKKILIPRRGEKDFEPLQDTVNLQEMMLQKSREALFGALIGVRGGNSKGISQAVLVPPAAFPRVLVTRGHLLDTLGITVRTTPIKYRNGIVRTLNVLLPEEALYLLERGSLQIWVAENPEVVDHDEAEIGVWSDGEFGVEGAVEMSVMEGYSTFIGKEGLSWERYQAYASLKRLGYTVQRSRRFLPSQFLEQAELGLERKGDASLPPFKSWWFSIPSMVSSVFGAGWNVCRISVRGIWGVLCRLRKALGGSLEDQSLGGSRRDYRSLLVSLRITPTLRSATCRSEPLASTLSTKYDDLDRNPYIPFFHVWKPAATWSKVKWDKGSPAGLLRHRPDFFVSVVDARTIPLPSLHQLAEVFETLPEEPKGPIRKAGPQYSRNVAKAPSDRSTTSRGVVEWLRLSLRPATSEVNRSHNNPIAVLRNGDRGFIVAVNDSGNTGWVRFGRAGFAGSAML